MTAFDRPFQTPYEMDQAMRDAWYKLVDVDDTIICLGDVSVDGSVQAHHQEWWREVPGAKWLVIGNHEVNRVGEVDVEGFEEIHPTLYAGGDPTLYAGAHAATHMSDGGVNVHGHSHNATLTRTRHVNASVEQVR